MRRSYSTFCALFAALFVGALASPSSDSSAFYADILDAFLDGAHVRDFAAHTDGCISGVQGIMFAVQNAQAAYASGSFYPDKVLNTTEVLGSLPLFAHQCFNATEEMNAQIYKYFGKFDDIAHYV